jgi:UDP-galactose transporter B1
VVTIGIVMFNLFKNNEGGSDKPLSFLSCGLLLVSLMGDGLLPDFQAEIKSEFKPGVLDMYFHINKYTTLIALLYAGVTLQIPYIFNYIVAHREFQMDLLLFSLLNAIGQLVIYRMIKLFKQHIPAFVIATRKCFTVIVSILHFDHQINYKQGIGMLLVFAAVLLEVYDNYLEKANPEVPEQQLAPKMEEEEKEQLSGEFEVRFLPPDQAEQADHQLPN